MKKLFFIQLFVMSLFLTSCTSGLFNKTAQAYEDSAKELESATSQEDCDRIHDELLRKLYDITLEYPNWKEIIEKESKESSAIKKVDKAYELWNKTLSEKAGTHSIFMTFCNFDVAIDKFGGKPSNEGDTEEDAEESRPFSNDSSDENNIDEYLTSYEEYCNDCISFIKKAANGDIEAITKYTELQEKAEELSTKMEKLEGNMTSEQLARFQKIQEKLTKASSELN